MAQKDTEIQNKPEYETELANYLRKIHHKLQRYKREKAEWMKSNRPIEVDVSVVKEEWKSNYYKGRCILLKKIGFKTTRLRRHFKNLRPLKCYTLTRKVFSLSEIVEKKSLKNLNLINKEGKLNDEEIKEGGEDEKEPNAEDIKKKNKKKLKKSVEKEKPLDPTKRILKKLKEQTYEEKSQGSCRCENGKEVTFIIKGLCLCDDAKLKNFATNKSCGQYCKSKINKMSYEPPPPAKEPSEISVEDVPKQEVIKEEVEEVKEIKEKDVKFNDVVTEIETKDVEVIEPEPEPEPEKSESFIILYKNDKTSKKSEMALTCEQKRILEMNACRPQKEKKSQKT